MSVNKNIFWCSSCLNTSTRPRISFDKNGICNACLWKEEKKKINWSARAKELNSIFTKLKKKRSSNFDLIIPVSGGKDGSYVTHICKTRYKLNPLCVTVNPPLRTKLGVANLENFKKYNLNLLEINLPSDTHKLLNKYGFINQGRPLYGWLIGIFTSVIKVAVNFNINLIMYGEDGEAEYGGVSKLKHSVLFDSKFVKKNYFSDQYEKTMKLIKNNNDKHWWEFPRKKNEVKMTHWSYFENWDSYRNYVVAKKNFGILEKSEKNVGTYTNFSQNDTLLYDLHTYLMFLKFGFGRANQDAGIDIRRGAITRDQAIQLVDIYDNEFPYYALKDYLEYFEMSEKLFFRVIDKFANKKLFKKVKNKWVPKFKLL